MAPPAPLARLFGPLLLVLALIGNLAVSFAPPPSAQRDLAAARADLAALLGPGLAFCAPAMTDEGGGRPGPDGTAACILCCLPAPLRLALPPQMPEIVPPAAAAVQAPWPPLVAEWREADPPPAPYRPRGPPSFA